MILQSAYGLGNTAPYIFASANTAIIFASFLLSHCRPSLPVAGGGFAYLSERREGGHEPITTTEKLCLLY
jgi:hypothetical protein